MTTYRKPVSNTWWLESKPYFFFVIREFTSLFVAGYCLFLLVFIAKSWRQSGSLYHTDFVFKVSHQHGASSDLIHLYFVPCHHMV